jgi:xanthine/uracil/vitamin C permease (AzgA family)
MLLEIIFKLERVLPVHVCFILLMEFMKMLIFANTTFIQCPLLMQNALKPYIMSSMAFMEWPVSLIAVMWHGITVLLLTRDSLKGKKKNLC